MTDFGSAGQLLLALVTQSGIPVSDDAHPSGLPPEIYQDDAFCKKYLIERKLGAGGAGIVVGARHRELDERIAIKFLVSRPQESQAVARFRREARAANKIKNEHVVRIIDVATTTAGVPYIVMEYLDGIDLERMLLQSPNRQLPIRDAIDFVLQACEALAECHRIGIVHRDLKPSNLFCVHGADGLPVIKVLDFGISKLISATVDDVSTGEHTIMGSPRYMSPEQFSSSADVDQRADIWALGLILYELITGDVPFVGSTLLSIWENVKSVIPQPLEQLRRDSPAALTAVVLKCLNKEREARYSNIAEFAKALMPFAAERSHACIAKIVRIVEAPGVTTESLALPHRADAFSEAPTVESLSPRVHVSAGAKKRRTRRIALIAASSTAVGALLAFRFATPSEPPASKHQAPLAESSPATKTPVATQQPANSALLQDVPETPAVTVQMAATGRVPTTNKPKGGALSIPPGTRATAIDAGSRQKETADPTAPPPASSNASPTTSSSSQTPPFLIDIVERRKSKP